MSSGNMSKNNSIVIWRIIFTYVIMFFHFDNVYVLTNILPGKDGWYIGVEFFFVVSGFLLYAKLEEKTAVYKSGLSYVGSRFRKIYPYYLISFILCFVFIWIRYGWSISDAIKQVGLNFWEIIALQGAGLNIGWNYINNTGWFISILFICEFLLYHMLAKWKDTTENFVIPIIMIVCFSFLYRNMGRIGAAPETTGFYENWGLMRGLLDMGFGIEAARLNKNIADTGKNIGIYRMFGNLGLFAVIVVSFIFGESKMDFIYLVIIAVSVSLAFLPSENKLFANGFIRGWSALTLVMYLMHDAFRTSIFPMIFGYPQPLIDRLLLLALYMAVVTLFSLVLIKTVKCINSSLKKEKVNA